MLYLIEPDGAVLSCTEDLGEALVAQRADGRALAELPWEPVFGDAARPQVVLTAALRHGIAIGRGLMVHGGFVEILLEPQRLRREAQEQQDIAANLEQLPRGTEVEYPKRLQQRDELHQRARQDTDKAISAADEAAQKVKDDPLREDLAAAWAGMGGRERLLQGSSAVE